MKKQTFRTCSPKKSSIDKGFRALGFSVAEAMVTLLIVSVALAAAAPIMSRSIKNQTNINSLWTLSADGNAVYRSSGNVWIGGNSSMPALLGLKNTSYTSGLRIDDNRDFNAQDETQLDGRQTTLITYSNGWRNSIKRRGGFYTRVAGNNESAFAAYTNSGKQVFRVSGNGRLLLSNPNDTVGEAISIENSAGNQIAYVNYNGFIQTNGGIAINAPAGEGTNQVVTLTKGDDTTMRVDASGKLVINSQDQHAIEIKNGENLKAWINSDGTHSLFPSGMVAFFSTPCANVAGGWSVATGTNPLSGYNMCVKN